MAQVTSGSFNTTKYDGRYYTLSWSATQSTANNNSSIKWTLTANGGNSSWYAERTVKVVIDGEAVFTKSDKVSRYTGTVATGTKVISHNANGGRSFAASVQAAVYTSSVNCTGSGSWELKSIPRAATITSAPNLTDGSTSATISFTNGAGNNVEALDACIATYNSAAGYYVDTISYRGISKTSGSYSFALDEDAHKALKKAVTAADGKMTIRYYLRTTIGGVKYHHFVERQYSLTDFAPTINPTIRDIGNVSTVLTGNNQKIIKGFNHIEYNIGAAGRDEATITNQRITCGNQTRTDATGVLYHIESGTIQLRAIDSRNTITEKTVTLEMIDYSPLTCRLDATIALDGETTSAIEFTVNGEWWAGNFGAVNNSVQLKYRLKTNSGNYGELISVTPSINTTKGTYSFNGTIGGLNYENSYTLQVVAYDKVYYGGIASKEIVLNTTPIFDYGKDDFNFNVPIAIKGVMQDYIVESGTNGIWTYEKWASGKAVCWGAYALQTTTNVAWHTTGVYIGNTDTSRINYPFNFIDKPVEIASLATGALATWLYSKSTNGASATGIYNVARFGANSNLGTFYINFYIVGKWR